MPKLDSLSDLLLYLLLDALRFIRLSLRPHCALAAENLFLRVGGLRESVQGIHATREALQCRELATAWIAAKNGSGIGVSRCPVQDAERWVRSIKEECLSKLILFGESSLRRALQQYMLHYHEERNLQGKENRILFPSQTKARRKEAPVWCRERLGGLLRYYEREAA